MVWGILTQGKTYSLSDWLVALLVTGGVAEFLFTGSITAPHKREEPDTGESTYGLLLLLGFLALDALTSTSQERLFKEHKMSKYNQMLFVGSFEAFTSLATLLLAGSLLSAAAFGVRHPEFIPDAFI